MVVDDYAHHPSEVKATLATAKKHGPQSGLIAMFQPHRFTRTQALKEEFGRAFPRSRCGVRDRDLCGQ